MPTEKAIRRFEDLIAWQKARQLVRKVYEVTNSGPFGKDLNLRNQARRSAVSIMDNIAEGFERGGRSEFHRFLSIAKGSCAELRSQLYVALDACYLDQATFQKLLNHGEEVARIIGGLRAAVQRQKRDGKHGQ